MAPYPEPAPPPITDQLIASSYGMLKPSLSYFESGRESDFAIFKMALYDLLSSHRHLNELYKYKVLLAHLKLQSAVLLANAYMHDQLPYISALQACRTSMVSSANSSSVS